MKRITLYTLLAAMTLGAPLFTACDSDRDDNPILRTDATTFNVDELGTAPYVLTAEGDNQLTLSCTQPDYGFPAAVTYSVDICLNDRFEEGKTQALGEYKGHSFTLKNKDLNAAVVKLWQAENEGDYAGKDATVYFRVKARLSANNSGETTGNLVHATVRMFAIPVTVELPEAMYLVGADIGTAWSTWQPLVAVTGMPGEFWGMFYFSEGGEFKFGKFEGDWTGYGAIKTLKDEAEAGVTGSDNIKVGKAGWYIVCITAKANATGDNLDYTMTFLRPEVYLIAAPNGTWGYDDAWKFTVPATKDGEFVSPALAGPDMLRIAVKAGQDWWRTEFTLKGGKEIVYRANTAVGDNLSELGPEYAASGSKGNKVYLNFANGTGSIK